MLVIICDGALIQGLTWYGFGAGRGHGVVGLGVVNVVG